MTAPRPEAEGSPGAASGDGVDVVVCLYGPSLDFPRCAESLARHTDFSRHRLVLVADGALAQAPARAVEGLRARGVEPLLLANEKRRGFVASANRGLRVALESARDGVLLNSDTEVTAGWLEKLAAAARARPDVATVTPFSNFATIASLPRFLAENALPAGYDVASFARLVEEVSERRYPLLPSGVGVCLYVRRAALERVGLLDEARFGLGYGEENDFSARASAAGFVHLLDDATYVHHAGHGSFGREKTERIRAAHRVLARRHPAFLPAVSRFLAEDPLRAVRERVVARLRPARRERLRGPSRVVHVVHGWPPFNHAGTESYARALVLAQAARREVAVFARVAHAGRATGDAIELLDGGARVRLLVNDFSARDPLARNAIRSHLFESDFERFLEEEAPDLVHVHHLAGHALALASVAARRGVPIVFQLQDWWTLCARTNLLDKERARCDGPALLKCARCVSLTAVPPAPLTNLALHAVRRVEALRALSAASAFVTGSRFLEKTFREHGFLPPGVPIHVLPYGVDGPAARPVRARTARPLRFGLLASLLPHKGAHVVAEAMRGVPRHAARLAIWGDRAAAPEYADEILALGGGADVRILPRFAEEEKAAVFGELDVLLVPSLGLESFGIAAREAFAHGVPVVASRDGALPELFPEEGAGGALLPPGDVSAWRAMITRLIESPELVDAWARRIPPVKPVAAHAEEIEDVYARLLEARRGARREPRGLA